MADPTPRDLDAARALLRGLCRAYLDGGEAAVLAKLAECCKAIDASDGEPTGEVPTRCPVCGCNEDFLQQQGAPPGHGALRCKAFGHMRPAAGWSWLPFEAPEEAPGESPLPSKGCQCGVKNCPGHMACSHARQSSRCWICTPAPGDHPTEQQIAAWVDALLAAGQVDGFSVQLICSPFAQERAGGSFFSDVGDAQQGPASPDLSYAKIRASVRSPEGRPSLVRLSLHRPGKDAVSARMVFVHEDGAPRKSTAGQYVIPLGKGAT